MDWRDSEIKTCATHKPAATHGCAALITVCGSVTECARARVRADAPEPVALEASESLEIHVQIQVRNKYHIDVIYSGN